MVTNLLLGGIFLLLLVYGGAHAWAAIEEALTERAVRAYVKQALATLNQLYANLTLDLWLRVSRPAHGPKKQEDLSWHISC